MLTACLLAVGGRAGAEVEATEAPPPPPEAETGTPAPPAVGGRYLQLPDISFVAVAAGKVSTDRRDAARDRLRLEEGELGIQSYVYPHLRADAFLVAPGHEDFRVELEEGYLTDERITARLSGRLGKFFVPFGRDNQKHPHSWPYVRRPLAWRNLVAEESLAGNGFSLSWLAPTGGRLFLQLDAGAYAHAGHAHGEEETGHAEAEDPANAILAGPGADFRDRFYTVRGWAGAGLGKAGELELGASLADGPAEPVEVDGGAPVGRNLRVTGVDLSYRRYGTGARRLLVRGEWLWRRTRCGMDRQTDTGYYALASYRFSKYGDVGMLYDWSEIPEAGGAHESALSAIYTHQMNEQTYARLQLTGGSRPGRRGYVEAWVQMVWGMGPHTHQLE